MLPALGARKGQRPGTCRRNPGPPATVTTGLRTSRTKIFPNPEKSGTLVLFFNTGLAVLRPATD